MKTVITLVLALSVIDAYSQEMQVAKEPLVNTQHVYSRTTYDDGFCRPPADRAQYVIDSVPVQDMPVTSHPQLAATSIFYTGLMLSMEQIFHMPATTLNDLLSIFPGVYQSRRGDAISIYGGRLGSNSYYIDGVQQ